MTHCPFLTKQNSKLKRAERFAKLKICQNNEENAQTGIGMTKISLSLGLTLVLD